MEDIAHITQIVAIYITIGIMAVAAANTIRSKGAKWRYFAAIPYVLLGAHYFIFALYYILPDLISFSFVVREPAFTRFWGSVLWIQGALTVGLCARYNRKNGG